MKDKTDDRERMGRAGNRRVFMARGCALCAGAMAGKAAPAYARTSLSSRPKRIKVVYALSAVKQSTPTWPNLGYDFAPAIERHNNALTNAFPDVEFIPVKVKGMNRANLMLTGDLAKDIDGYIVVQMNAWNLPVHSIAASGKPVLLADFPYGGSGGVLVFGAMLKRAGRKNVGVVSSSDLADLVEAARCFNTVERASDFGAAVAAARKERTPAAGDLSCLPDPLPAVTPEEAMARMRESKILAVGYPGVSFVWGPLVKCEMVPYSALGRAYKRVDREEAGEIAARWQRTAAKIEGVSDQTMEDSAAMYLAMKALLKDRGANAFTIDCLNGFYNGLLNAYPCLGFHELCNEGLVGACECDVRSASTMLAVNAMTAGRPGYISDPVLDSSKRRIIYAHCVAPNRAFGPDGAANEFEILTHSEDRQGASVRSILPVGYMTTTIEIAAEKKQILFHQAKALDNDPDDRACRTKLAAEPVGDFEKLFTMWDIWGWHRVTVYGDLKEQTHALADALGYRVVTEA